MGYTLHSASVGLKMLASWWNEFVFAIGDLDIRTLRLEALAPVENSSATSGTQNTTSYAASSSGALTAACVVPASGDVVVTIQAEQYGAAVNVQRTSAAITVSSGAGATAASDANSIKSVSIASGTASNNGVRSSCSWLITGMTPGATVTATMQHRVETGSTTGNTFLNRRISINPQTGY